MRLKSLCVSRHSGKYHRGDTEKWLGFKSYLALLKAYGTQVVNGAHKRCVVSTEKMKMLHISHAHTANNASYHEVLSVLGSICPFAGPVYHSSRRHAA